MSDGEAATEQRLAALETGLAELLQRVERLSARLERHEDTLSLLPDVALYAPLRAALEARRWREADTETTRILYASLNTTLEEVTPELVGLLPITPVGILDQLWRAASHERFGFRAQIQIYQGLGGSLDSLIAQDADRYQAFCERTGWRQEGRLLDPDDPAASLPPDPDDAPVGALPRRCWNTPYGMKLTNLILARLISGGL
jgi:hypothetical protein